MHEEPPAPEMPTPAVSAETPPRGWLRKIQPLSWLALLTALVAIVNIPSSLGGMDGSGIRPSQWYSLSLYVLWVVASYGVARTRRWGIMLYSMLGGLFIGMLIQGLLFELDIRGYMASSGSSIPWWSYWEVPASIAVLAGALAFLWRRFDSFK